MGGKSGQTVGYWFKNALAYVWAQKADTLHRFGAGGKQAWDGCVHECVTHMQKQGGDMKQVVSLSKLEEIRDLRTVWPHEALDFTPWLSQDDNISLLADAIGIDITVDETESSVGDFNVDIFAFETGTDRKIIIENQLQDTNHDYIGKKKIMVHNGLKVGEKVILLQQSGGQRYIVLDRVFDHRTEGQWL